MIKCASATVQSAFLPQLALPRSGTRGQYRLSWQRIWILGRLQVLAPLILETIPPFFLLGWEKSLVITFPICPLRSPQRMSNVDVQIKCLLLTTMLAGPPYKEDVLVPTLKSLCATSRPSLNEINYAHTGNVLWLHPKSIGGTSCDTNNALQL